MLEPAGLPLSYDPDGLISAFNIIYPFFVLVILAIHASVASLSDRTQWPLAVHVPQWLRR